MDKTFKIKHHKLGMIALAVILFLCLTPAKPNLMHVFTFFDKVVHFSLYLFLSLLFFWEFSRVSNYGKSRLFLRVALFAFLFSYGLSIEFLQDWMALGREYDPYDMLANMLGASAGMLLSPVLLKFLPAKQA